jgi:uncharacterized protein (DUF302 family)
MFWFGSTAALAQADYAKVVQVRGSFEDVKESLVLAIEGKGLVINTTAHVGDMQERTGRDIGQDRQIYGKAEVIEFCSAKVSRALMAADPKAIVLCPYSIAVYTVPARPGQVTLAYRKFPPVPGLKPVADLLEDIVRDAVK